MNVLKKSKNVQNKLLLTDYNKIKWALGCFHRILRHFHFRL